MFYKAETSSPPADTPEQRSSSGLGYRLDSSSTSEMDTAECPRVQAEPRRATRAAEDVFGAPFKDTPERFWEKTAAFCGVALLGIIGATFVVFSGLAPLPLVMAALSCGVISGVMVWQTSGNDRAIRSVAASTLLSAVLFALLLEVGRIIFIFPTRLESVVTAVACWLAVYCIACFLVPMVAVFGMSKWSAAGTRLLLNWHRAIGTVVLTVAYLCTAVPAALAVAPAPCFARVLLGRIVRVPLWSWLMPLNEVARMVAVLVGTASPSDPPPNTWRTALASTGRSFATIPLVIFGMTYALLASAAHILTKLSAEATTGDGAVG